MSLTFFQKLKNISGETDTAKLITQEANNDDENSEVKLDENSDMTKNDSKDSKDHVDNDEIEDSPESRPEEKSTDEHENEPEAITTENPVLEAAMSPSFDESSSFEEFDKKKRLKKMLINVIVLGMSFLLMYTAFQVIKGVILLKIGIRFPVWGRVSH